MTRRVRRRVRDQRDWWTAAVFVGLTLLLIIGAESQLAGADGLPIQFARSMLRGLMLVAAGMALSAVLPEPERELKAARRTGFWLAALVPLIWLLFQWFAAIVGSSGWGSLAWLITTPLPAFWFGAAAGTALRQVLGR